MVVHGVCVCVCVCEGQGVRMCNIGVCEGCFDGLLCLMVCWFGGYSVSGNELLVNIFVIYIFFLLMSLFLYQKL